MLTLVLADCTMKVGPKEIDLEISRPDMVHIPLLLAQDSGLAGERELKVIIHTRENKVFRFDTDVDIPEDLDEFKNMIIRTVQGHPIQGIHFSEETLMKALQDEFGHKVVMSPNGTKKDPVEMFSRAEDYVVVIGGFASGDFVSPVYEWADEKVSISDEMMKPWTVASEVLVAYRYCSLE